MDTADPSTRRRPPPFEIPPGLLVALAGAGAVAGSAALGAEGPAVAGLAAMAAMAAGLWLGRRRDRHETRRRQFRVADELAQYRAFTRLMRSQGDRIVGLGDDAATTIALGLRQVDESLDALGQCLARIEAEGAGPAALASARDAVESAARPMLGMLAALQFQDVTRQQIDFLARLSTLLDTHMTDLARMLGDRRSLDRTTRFRELFDQAMTDTVMRSQRDDHRAANGLDAEETAGPAVELFFEEERPG